jgi:hypothetical protein
MNNNYWKCVYGTGIVGSAMYRSNEFVQENVEFNKWNRTKNIFKDTPSSATIGLLVGTLEGIILPLTLVSTLAALPTIIKNYLKKVKVN